MSEVADLLQTFLRGIARPETNEVGYGIATNAQRNLEYYRLTGTTAQRPGAPPTGWTYFDQTTEELIFWDGDSWVSAGSGGGGGGGLTAPANPGEDGYLAVADGGDILWTDPSMVTVGSADTATVAAAALAVTITGPTDIGFGAVTDGHLLIRSGTSFIGVAASTLTVASAANSVKTEGLDFNGTVLTCDTAPNDTHLLRRSGTTVGGVAASTLSVSYASTAGSATTAVAASALLFNSGATQRDCSATAPTAHQILISDTSDDIAGLNPSALMRRASNTLHSTAALTFTANASYEWNGSATPSFTISKTGAVDGATITIFFTAGYLDSIAFSTDMDPTGTLAYAFDDDAAAYSMTVQFRAGSFVTMSFNKVTVV